MYQPPPDPYKLLMQFQEESEKWKLLAKRLLSVIEAEPYARGVKSNLAHSYPVQMKELESIR